MKLLLSEHVLGRVQAYFYSIEWQKCRGLPHAHILIIMENDSKPKSAEAINNVVSAEIPNKQINPKLILSQEITFMGHVVDASMISHTA